MRRKAYWLIGGGVIAAIASFMAIPALAAGAKVVVSTSGFTVFADPYGNGAANPAAEVSGRVHAVELPDHKTIVTLDVTGLPAGREFGAHVHKLVCSDTKAGGHYQNVSGGASDPAFANAQNEIWLDFTTNAAGHGRAQAVVDWSIRPDGANAVVIHDHHTSDIGAAGPKLACINVDF